ncbi:MAG: hypothetical protein ABSH39_22235, partial [Candidatus Acidiferrum sp.]
PRTTNIETDHIFIEHGQRFDWANRDGNRFGCDTTNEAVHSFLGIKKKFDSTRRETFVAGATLWWTVSRMSFGLYVQGHTHHNVLKYVEVSHVRSDNTWVPVGKGARIQVETKKSL